jgi:methionine-rich copper-binding protein CopC
MNARCRMLCGTFAILALTCNSPVWAHAALVKSEPARRATLSKSPRQIRLWFNERLEPEYATITLIKGGGSQIATEGARVNKDDAKLLVLDLPALVPGDYTVKYRVLSVDGHTLDYGYTFSVK